MALDRSFLNALNLGAVEFLVSRQITDFKAQAFVDADIGPRFRPVHREPKETPVVAPAWLPHDQQTGAAGRTVRFLFVPAIRAIRMAFLFCPPTADLQDGSNVGQFSIDVAGLPGWCSPRRA